MSKVLEAADHLIFLLVVAISFSLSLVLDQVWFDSAIIIIFIDSHA